MNEQITCYKCGREFEPKLPKTVQRYKQGKKIMCPECREITNNHWIEVMAENNLLDWEKYREDHGDEY